MLSLGALSYWFLSFFFFSVLVLCCLFLDVNGVSLFFFLFIFFKHTLFLPHISFCILERGSQGVLCKLHARQRKERQRTVILSLHISDSNSINNKENCVLLPILFFFFHLVRDLLLSVLLTSIICIYFLIFFF